MEVCRVLLSENARIMNSAQIGFLRISAIQQSRRVSRSLMSYARAIIGRSRRARISVYIQRH